MKKTAMGLLACTTLVAPVTPFAKEVPRKPNIIIIYADDMGRGDLSAYGNKLVATKNIDSLATQGTSFSDAYVTAPLCSPSRAGMLTGRYQQKFGFEQQVSSGAYPEKRAVQQPDGSYAHIDREDYEPERRGVPPSEANIAEILKPYGYKTAVVGKWHLGHTLQYQPQNRGFDYSFVFYGNTSLQYKDLDDPGFISKKVDRHDALPLTAWTREGINAIRRNGEIVDVNTYLLWRFRDEAINFVETNKDQPFFLYLAINAPVPPLQVPRAYYDRLSHIEDENVRAYNAYLLAYDDAIGEVLAKVRALGLDESTIIIFASDNGNAETRPGSNAPFSGGKFNTLEGGIRTPFIVKWTGHVKAGETYTAPVSTLDILPTVTAAAQVTLPETKQTDGVNLLPYLSGANTAQPHRALYWKLGDYAAVREGKWKLYVDHSKGITALYDLEADPEEKTDLSSAHPQTAKRLQKQYSRWEKDLPPPSWRN